MDEPAVDVQLGEPVRNERSHLADQRAGKDQTTEDSPPDWGGSSDEEVQTSEHNQQWPWGEAGFLRVTYGCWFVAPFRWPAFPFSSLAHA